MACRRARLGDALVLGCGAAIAGAATLAVFLLAPALRARPLPAPD